MNDVRAGAGYGIGRPVCADWLDELQEKVIKSLPEGYEYIPAVKPSIAFVSGKEIADTEGTRLFGAQKEEAETILDDVISKLYGKRACDLLQQDIGLAIARYRIQFGDHGTVLRLNSYDSFVHHETSGFWRVESEKLDLRRRLGFDGSISRKNGNNPKYWLSLGTFTMSSMNGDLQRLRSAVVPALSRSPRFAAVTTFYY